jgi:hypothetical protein
LITNVLINLFRNAFINSTLLQNMINCNSVHCNDNFSHCRINKYEHNKSKQTNM